MRELIAEGRGYLALLREEGAVWSNVRQSDGSYKVTFSRGKMKGKTVTGDWKNVHGHRVLVTKSGEVVGLPDKVKKAVKGAEGGEAGGGALDLDDAPDDVKAERKHVRKLKGMSDGAALEHLDKNMDDIPASEDSKNGGGILHFIGKLVAGVASKFSALVRKVRNARKGGDAEGASAALEELKAANKEMTKANELYKKRLDQVDKAQASKGGDKEAKDQASKVAQQAQKVAARTADLAQRAGIGGKAPKAAEPPKVKEKTAPQKTSPAKPRELKKAKKEREKLGQAYSDQMKLVKRARKEGDEYSAERLQKRAQQMATQFRAADRKARELETGVVQPEHRCHIHTAQKVLEDLDKAFGDLLTIPF